MEKQTTDILWVLFCAALIFTMQAGFLCLEAGVTRRKNNINVAMKNLSDFAVSTLVYWLLGYALMFGLSWNGWIGLTEFAPNLGNDQFWRSASSCSKLCSAGRRLQFWRVQRFVRFCYYVPKL